MKDSYYTSTDLAINLVRYVSIKNCTSVADFCIGGGELLRAAIGRFPDICCYGTDISQDAILELQKKHPTWNTCVCDFTSEINREDIFFLKGKFDLILLNPPFTCKGSKINTINYNESIYHVSTAMMFLVYSLQYLRQDGEILAILPISTMYSNKDAKIRTELSKNYNIQILEESEKHNFKECSPSIVLISIKKGASITGRNQQAKIKLPISCNSKYKAVIIRGKISMYQTSNYKGDLQLIHTTSMRNNRIINTNILASHPQSEVQGPAILIPRVGNPSIQKICTITGLTTYTLSDCVIAIKFTTIKDMNKVFKSIIKDWENFKELYKGTGAKYITIERLKLYLNI